MPITHEYCIIKNGIVENIIVADAAFAAAHAAALGAASVQRPFMSVGIGHTYHDNKFWRMQQDYDENGQPTGDPYEVEITE